MLEQHEASAFAKRVASLLERVEYRRADSAQDKEAIFRMRYEAYAREGFIEPNGSGLFTDADDECPNAWLIAVFIDGALASSIRLHIASRPDQFLPVSKGFPDIIMPRLEAGDLIIDASRQTSRLEFTRAYPFLPYITMRSAFIAEDHFGGDFITAACRPEYRAAFRRMYGAAGWAPPRPYPPLTPLQALMAYDCKGMRHATRTRYPFVDSTPEEQRRLFGRSSNVERDPYEELTAGRRARRGEGKQQSTTCAA
ncbi:MAG TPA: hypothetical protein VN715_03710 [Roseiarcus sp.]|nr:hypothetical protein [Roseiarcus sp.]